MSDFLLFQNDQVFVTTTENTVHGISYLRLPSPATRLIHGMYARGKGVRGVRECEGRECEGRECEGRECEGRGVHIS